MVGRCLSLPCRAQSSSPASSFTPAVSSSAVQTSQAIPTPYTPSSPHAALAVVGSLAVDITMHPFSASPLQTTAPGTVSLTLGGVAGNVARAAHSILGSNETLLIAPIGRDLLGTVAETGLRDKGMRTDGLISAADGSGEAEAARTATCGYLVDEKGELIGGVADMKIAREVEGRKVRFLATSRSRCRTGPSYRNTDIVSNSFGWQIVENLIRAHPKVVAFDGNISPESMAQLLVHCQKSNIDSELAVECGLIRRSDSPALFFQLSSNPRRMQIRSSSSRLCNNPRSLPYRRPSRRSSATRLQTSTNCKLYSKASPLRNLRLSNLERGSKASPSRPINSLSACQPGSSTKVLPRWRSACCR